LDEILTRRGVLEVLDALAWSREAVDPELTHDLPHELLVDDQSLLDLQRGADPQHPVGAP
jgi:hypothetical protein